ncbi:MAG: hypothetical protein J2P50_14030 [Hyphomicrobiaceae bacterium]|nr:hypothetical protein [Hyphomicrobiaceae bacterium]
MRGEIEERVGADLLGLLASSPMPPRTVGAGRCPSGIDQAEEMAQLPPQEDAELDG